MTAIAEQTETVVEGVTNWEDMVQLQGTASYSGSGNYDCSGTNCGSGSSGSFTFNMNVDYDAKLVTGGSISLSGVLTDGTSINSSSYDGLTGQEAMFPQFSNTNFDGTSINFTNSANGKTADGVHVELYLDNAADTATGAGEGQRQSGGPPPS